MGELVGCRWGRARNRVAEGEAGLKGGVSRSGYTELEVELGLRRPAGGVEPGGRSGPTDMGEIWMMGSGSGRNAMNVRGVWQAGQISGNTS